MQEKPEPSVRVVDRRWWARSEAEAARDEAASTKPTYVEELERRVAEQAAELQTYSTEHRRALEEFEQAKVRLRRDVAREVARGKRAVLSELLEVLDNLNRALDAAEKSSTSSDALVRGVELVRDQFSAKLAALGVARIPALGQAFDASLHEAVSMAPVSDPSSDGTIVAVLKDGYALGDELLRPASVVVGEFRDHNQG